MVKEKLVLELVLYHCNHNDKKFNETAYKIAKELIRQNKDQLADYILAQIGAVPTFVPMEDKKPPIEIPIKEISEFG